MDRRYFTKDVDCYDTRQAKQRASIKWLLSKAHNNKVPDDVKEPFYRDHEDQEHLKPQIVRDLANATLYCLAFANIYSDPNFNNLNHWGLLQTLARKGITVPETPTADGPLTETVLIQTTPIKLAAHIAVIEAMMTLYAKEVATPDRVVSAIQRFTPGTVASLPTLILPADAEHGLLLWVAQSQLALSRRIASENGEHVVFNEPRDIAQLNDGVAIAALIAFYCPEELPWREIKRPPVHNVSDSVHNLCLVHEFCHHSLPANVFHMMPEDVTYLQSSMKQNLIVLLADLFNVLEIHPVKCVRFPVREAGAVRNSQGVAHKRSLPQPITGIPDLRSHLTSHSSSFTVPKPTGSSGIRKSHSSPHADSYFRGSPDSLDRLQDDRRSDESYVVHRSRAVPTLSTIALGDGEPLIPARLRPNKERGNSDSKWEERGETAAGKPSNYDEHKRTSYSGRRSRRNSLSDDSQLTLENFGGSQENLHFLGRNPDKDPATFLSGSPALSTSPAVRSSAQDARSAGVELIFSGGGSSGFDWGGEGGRGKSPSPAPPTPTPSVPVRSTLQDARSTAIDRIFADNGYGIEKVDRGEKERDFRGSSHSKQSDRVDGDVSSVIKDHFESSDNSIKSYNSEKKTTSFATLPNTTTWQQQQKVNLSSIHDGPNLSDDSYSTMQLHNIRLKLEEKRRAIETEKRQLELKVNKQRAKLGKAAFLQAVTKGKVKPSESPKKSGQGECAKSVQEFADESSYDGKWNDSRMPDLDEPKTPDLDNIDLEAYQRSIAQMNTSLNEIDSDMRSLNLHTNVDCVDEEKYHQKNHRLYSSNNYGRQSPSLSNQTVTLSSLSSSSPPSKISLSQLHHQQQNQHQQQPQQTGHFYLHDQPVRRTWSARAATTTWKQQQQTDNANDRNLNQSPEPPTRGFMLHNSENSPRLPNGDGPTPSPRSIRPVPPPKPTVSKRVTPMNRHPSEDDMAPQSICFIGDNDNGGNEGNIAHINITSGSRTYRIPSPTRPNSAKNAFSHRVKQGEAERGGNESGEQKGFYVSFDDAAPPKRPKPPLRGKRSPKKDRFQTQIIEGRYEPNKDNNVLPDEDEERLESAKTRVNYSPEQVKNSSLSNHSPRPTQYSPDQPITRKSAAALSATPPSSGQSAPISNYETPRFQPLRTEEPVTPGVGLVIGSEADPNVVDEMERKKERILRMSIQRRQQQEEVKARKELELQERRDLEKLKEEDRARKKEEEKQRRAAILEQYKLKKAIEEAEREGKVIDKEALLKMAAPKMRSKPVGSSTMRPRPKTIHIETGSGHMDGNSVHNVSSGGLSSSRGNRGSSSNLQDRSHENSVFNRPLRRDHYRGSHDSLAGSTITPSRRGYHRESPGDGPSRGTSPTRTHIIRRGSYKTSRDTSEPPKNRGRPTTQYSTYQSNFKGRKSNSLMNLCGSSTDQENFAGYRYTDTDSGLGRATPPRRAPSPGSYGRQQLTYPSVGPGSLPPGLTTKRRIFDDGASDISSNASSMMEYNGPRLYKQPATKSNRGIMLNAVEYCVFPGVVNKTQKSRVLEEIARSESKHFLILFRDAGCQFRALYSYCPDTEEVIKLFGTGPKMVNDTMFDRFFKYNSGGKCFSQVHTKHLTVTIDAFTIHNSLWQGKKVNLPSKKDMALVI